MKIEIEAIDDIKKWYKLYSVWFFALIVAAPELYNLAISLGWFSATQVPAGFSRLVQTIAALGGVFRVIKQKQTTLAGLTTQEQAAVALGLETTDEATADQAAAAQAAQAALAAQGPATPGVLVISPVPEPVQQAVDAQKALEATAASAPTPAPAPVADAAPAPMAQTLNAVAEPTPAPVVAAPVVEAATSAAAPEVRESVMAVEVPAPVAAPVEAPAPTPAAAPVPAAPAVAKKDPITEALAADLKAVGLHAESDITEIIDAVKAKVDGEFTKTDLKDPVVKQRFFDRVKSLTEELVTKVETLAKKL